MSVTPQQLAQSITDELNGAGFQAKLDDLNTELGTALAFTAKRGYIVTFTLQQLKQLQVVCVPKSFETQSGDETGWERKLAVDIGVMCKLTALPIRNGDELNPLIDPLMCLVSLIVDHFLDADFEADCGYPVDKEAGVQNAPIYSQKALREQSQFTSVITVHFMEVE